MDWDNPGLQAGSPEAERPVGQFELGDIPAEFDGQTALETLAEPDPVLVDMPALFHRFSFSRIRIVIPQLSEYKGIIKKALDGVKVLGDGEVGKAVTVRLGASQQ